MPTKRIPGGGAWNRSDAAAKTQVNWQAVTGGVLQGAGAGLLAGSGADSGSLFGLEESTGFTTTELVLGIGLIGTLLYVAVR